MALTTAEVLTIRAEGCAASRGDVNPYIGDTVRASVWRGGYDDMIGALLEASPARQALLRARRRMTYF